MRMTTEEAFVKVLQRHGVAHAFGIIGSAMMPISDLFPAAGITFWDCAHEGSAGMMADGYTRATGRMAMAIAQNGPGITNFVTAVKTAYWNHSPLLLVKKLLELGANPNYPDAGGFPSLFAALDSKQPDRCDRLTMLLNYGADIQQRGVNDYTPLHHAAMRNDGEAVSLLLARGADPTARTRIDHYATALEEAEYFGHRIGAEALRRAGVTV